MRFKPDNEQRIFDYGNFTWLKDYFKTYRPDSQNFPGMKSSWRVCSHDLSLGFSPESQDKCLRMCPHISEIIHMGVEIIFKTYRPES